MKIGKPIGVIVKLKIMKYTLKKEIAGMYDLPEGATGIFVKEYLKDYSIPCITLKIQGREINFRKADLIKITN